MAYENSQPMRALRRLRPDPWSVAALAVAALATAPLVSVLVIAATPDGNVWPHLWATVLPRYLRDTLILMAGVGTLAGIAGTGAAWLTVTRDFPGRRWLDWAMLFPLAVPAYVGAYALVDFLDYAGPFQTFLRGLMGWTDARDYRFPEIRSRWAAIVVLAGALYPYVYLLARAAFREQSGAAHEVARALGTGPWGLFWRVGLPLARPAIAAGVALVLMETVADYGTVAHFGVQTLTTGIFSTWLTAGNAAGAAQIATLLLGLVIVLVAVERASRRRARHHGAARGDRPLHRTRLAGWRGWAATGFCLAPLAVGFALPVGVMLGHGLRNPDAWVSPGLGRALANTLVLGATAAALTVALALVLVFGARMSRHALPRRLLPVATLGYAAPGAVLALGLLVPLAALDNRVADAVLALTGRDPGLILTGTMAALVIAFVVRFFGIAQGALEAGLGRINPSLPLAARLLGRSPGGTLGTIYMPLLRGSLATALLLVFVDSVKELPATLFLRPFNFDTLSTRVYELASLERLSEAAPAALLVMLVGLAAVAFVARATREPG